MRLSDCAAVIVLTVLTIRHKNLSLEQSLQELQANLSQASKIIGALPNSKYGTSFDQVMQYARVGVAQAEQLYKISQIEGDARKEGGAPICAQKPVFSRRPMYTGVGIHFGWLHRSCRAAAGTRVCHRSSAAGKKC